METIRIAQQEDSTAIARVHVESWRTTYKDIVPVEHHHSYDQRLSMWQQILWFFPDKKVRTLEIEYVKAA